MKYSFMMVLCMSTLLQAQPLIIGHRGASGYEPENTLLSFKQAMNMNVDMIELDVYVCLSGEIVVIHDDTIERTTNGTGYVKDLTWQKLKNYDAGKGERIPLLEEVFDLVNKRLRINIELKDPAAAQPVAELIKYYIGHKQWSAKQFLVSSSYPNALRTFHSYCSQVETGIIFEENLKPNSDVLQQLQNTHACYAIMSHTTITQKLVRKVHKHGIKIFAYTVNSPQHAQRLRHMDIDGIITDYPDVVR